MIAVMRHRCETMTHCGPHAVIHFPCNLIRQRREPRIFTHHPLSTHECHQKQQQVRRIRLYRPSASKLWSKSLILYKKRSLFSKCKALIWNLPCLSDRVLPTSRLHVSAPLWRDHSDKPQWGLSQCNNDDSLRYTKLCREAEDPFWEVDWLKIPLGPSAAID